LEENKMNRLLSLTMVFALLLVGMVSADSYVMGKVTDGSNNPVAGVALDINCDGELASTTTDAYGLYVVGLDSPDCDPGDMAYVTATDYDVTNSGEVCNGPESNLQCDGIDLALVNLTIPEFGMIAGAVALVGALGIFMYRRK
jgi:hypothetical protein